MFPAPAISHRLRTCLWIATVSAALCSTVEATRRKDPTAQEKAIVEDGSKGWVGAIYLDKVRESTGLGLRVYVRAKVLSKSGFDIGNVDGLPVSARSIEGRTVGPNGRVTELSSKDVRTVRVVRANGRSVETKSFAMPALEPGCFIEYSYVETGTFGKSGEYQTEILFQDKYPILHEEVSTPRDIPFASNLKLQNGVSIHLREEGGKYVYEAFDAPAARAEPFGLPENVRCAEVIFAYVFPGLSGRTIEEFWKRATDIVLVPYVKRQLIRRGRVSDRLKSIAGSRESDPAGRLRAIYRYVQSDIKNRYALALGEAPPPGGYKQNEDAGDTFSRASGTPTDLAAAFASLLRADGWNWRAVWVGDREERLFFPTIPSVFQFDGWVIEVENPRDTAHPFTLSFEHPLLAFAEVPWNHLGIDCFAVDVEKDRGEVIRLPETEAKSNTRRRSWTVQLTKDGDAKIDRSTIWTGYRAFEVRADLYREGRAGWEKELRDAYEKLDPPASIESVSFENETDPDQDLRGEIRLLRRGVLASLPGGRITFSPLLMLEEQNPFTSDHRNDPIIFPYRYITHDTLTVTPPPGYALEGLPRAIDERTGAGHYTVTLEHGPGQTIVLKREFALEQHRADAQYYGVYRNLFGAAARGDAGLTLVFKRAVSAATP